MWGAWAGFFVLTMVARRLEPDIHPDLATRISFGLFAVFVASGLAFLTSTLMLLRRARSEFARAATAAGLTSATRTASSLEFQGGATLSNLMHASWPLARLTIEPARLALRMPMVGSIVIPAGSVMSVKPRRGFLSRGGLRIDTDIGGEYVTFFPMSQRDAVMHALQAAGYPCMTGPGS
jgi:hypothetical protein